MEAQGRQSQSKDVEQEQKIEVLEQKLVNVERVLAELKGLLQTPGEDEQKQR